MANASTGRANDPAHVRHLTPYRVDIVFRGRGAHIVTEGSFDIAVFRGEVSRQNGGPRIDVWRDQQQRWLAAGVRYLLRMVSR